MTPHSDPTFDHPRDPGQLVDDLDDDPQGFAYSFEGSDGLLRTIVVEQLLHRAEGRNGWNSAVLEVKCVCSLSGCDWHEENKILKVYHLNMDDPVEEQFIWDARENAESSGEHWALDHLPNIIDAITCTITLPPEDEEEEEEEEEEDMDQDDSESRMDEDCEKHVLQLTILEKLHPLSEVQDLKELSQVFYDILQIHQWLYECAGILHRDLSSGNIMFRRKHGKIYGVLNDFGLSSHVQDTDLISHRAGTQPFMSVDLLNSNWEGGHLYRHDLESLFFVMLCLACRYDAPGVPATEPRPYSYWYTETNRNVYHSKNSFFLDPDFETFPIQPHFIGLKSWLEEIYCSFHFGYIQRPFFYSHDRYLKMKKSLGRINVGIADFDFDYDWTTLGKCASYARMRSIMSLFNGGSLATRWAGWNPER
ncbi:protein kinase [Lentinula boryana]|uniref:Protein kinase n=1 Tax=Lentinula boryana TaxID=40481 RepID=A0ABQ8Q0V1_9AGAR|nr:protein kinase [Lentinula boryana]